METLFPIGLPAAALPTVLTYRYFRMDINRIHQNTSPTSTYEMEVYVDATKYPTVPMTGNTSPAPLVADASSAQTSHQPWWMFNHSTTQVFNGNTLQNSDSNGYISPPFWISIDLGAGNEITPTKFSVSWYNTGGLKRVGRDLEFFGSNNGIDWDSLLEVIDSPLSAHKEFVDYVI